MKVFDSSRFLFWQPFGPNVFPRPGYAPPGAAGGTYGIPRRTGIPFRPPREDLDSSSETHSSEDDEHHHHRHHHGDDHDDDHDHDHDHGHDLTDEPTVSVYLDPLPASLLNGTPHRLLPAQTASDVPSTNRMVSLCCHSQVDQ